MKLVGIASTAWLAGALALTGCANEARRDSVNSANFGAREIGQKHYDSAIVACKTAVEKWQGNHNAWYNLAQAYAGKRDWPNAVDAMSHAVQLVPDQAVYQLTYGEFLYSKAIQTGKEEQAKREGKKSADDVTVDLSTINFEQPLQALQEALKLNSELWAAHYYIGRIYRDTGKAKEAAGELTSALRAAPTDPGPWVALAELYRRWDYTDQAIQIAEAGTSVVRGADEKSDIWFEAGMGYEDKRADDRAIDAFTKSLDGRRDNHKARFERGQAYFRKADYPNAQRDLLEFSKTGGASLEFDKQQASKMLIDIAAKSVVPGSTPVDAPPAEPKKPPRRPKNH